MSRAMLAKLHIAKKEVGLDDDTYRDVLERLTGQRTAKGLSTMQIARVLDDMRARGWTGATAPSKRQPSAAGLVRKIWALWSDMCEAGIPREPTREALRSFVQRMTGVGSPEWLDVEQARKVIEGLKAWKARGA